MTARLRPRTTASERTHTWRLPSASKRGQMAYLELAGFRMSSSQKRRTSFVTGSRSSRTWVRHVVVASKSTWPAPL